MVMEFNNGADVTSLLKVKKGLFAKKGVHADTRHIHTWTKTIYQKVTLPTWTVSETLLPKNKTLEHEEKTLTRNEPC